VSHFNKIPAQLVVSIQTSVLGFDQQRATERFPTGWDCRPAMPAQYLKIKRGDCIPVGIQKSRAYIEMLH
jgi:hypothetical protein